MRAAPSVAASRAASSDRPEATALRIPSSASLALAVPRLLQAKGTPAACSSAGVVGASSTASSSRTAGSASGSASFGRSGQSTETTTGTPAAASRSATR
jgi:hypothetical protein